MDQITFLVCAKNGAQAGLALLLGGLGVVLLLNSFNSESLARWSVRGPLFVLGGLVLFGLTVPGSGCSSSAA